MQRRTLVSGVYSAWADIASWVEDGPGYYYPYSSSLANVTTEFRLKCTLASGEVYYSNIISASLRNPDCYASDDSDGPGELLQCRFGWSRAEYNASDVLLSTTTGETVIGCNETYVYLDDSPHRRIIMRWQTLGDGSGYRIRAYLEIPGGSVIVDNIWNTLRTGWVKIWKCFPAVHALTPAASPIPLSTRREFAGSAVAAYTVLTITSVGLETPP